jgi:hypothetical protein
VIKQSKQIVRWSAGLAGAMLAVAALAEVPPPCPPAPEPANPASDAPVYISRDIETCRIFSPQMSFDMTTNMYTFYWAESTLPSLQWLTDMGLRIVFNDMNFSGTKVLAAEYLNSDLDHYFMALPEEAAAIDAGAAGPRWTRTGLSFVVREPTSSPIARYVRRFYGSISPGPNSHFFTMDSEEGKAIERISAATPTDQPRWNSEGISFSAFPVMAGGACAAYQVPVWRAYNGGFARGLESNHRFSTDKSVIDGMVSRGWISEGVAFCVNSSL